MTSLNLKIPTNRGTISKLHPLRAVPGGLPNLPGKPERDRFARGRVALARKGLEGELKLSCKLFEQMYACFDCLAWNTISPVGIRPADLAMDMRKTQEEIQPKPWKKVLFEGSSPNRFVWKWLPGRCACTRPSASAGWSMHWGCRS